MNGLNKSFDCYNKETEGGVDKYSFALGVSHVLNMIEMLIEAKGNERVISLLIRTLKKEAKEMFDDEIR